MNTPPTYRNFLRQLDFETLDLFILICQSGSIGAAAAQGQLAPSSVSKRIKELEILSQVQLFTRHARGVEPTAAGACLLRHATSILMAAEHLRMDITEFAQGLTDYVHIFASASAVEQYLAQEIARFARSNPTISIDLSQVTSKDVVRAIRTGDADFGICETSEDAADMEFHPYRSEQLVLVVHKSHALAAQTAVAYSETLQYEQIGFRGSSMIQQLLETAALRSNKILRQRIKVSSLSALCRMVESGLGIGILPKGVVKTLAMKGELKSLTLTDDWACRELFVCARRFANLSVAAKQFLAQLVPRISIADPDPGA